MLLFVPEAGIATNCRCPTTLVVRKYNKWKDFNANQNNEYHENSVVFGDILLKVSKNEMEPNETLLDKSVGAANTRQ
jgi:predicted negative regulator of RcsB-dependent stress response